MVKHAHLEDHMTRCNFRPRPDLVRYLESIVATGLACL